MLRGAMIRGRLAALTAAIVLVTRGAHAEESSFSDRFFRGTSPGELPPAKVAVVGGLYVAAVASVSLGVASFIQAGNKGDEADTYKQGQVVGFCNDLSTPACAGYRTLLDEERTRRAAGWMLLGAGGLFALGGALTAELWQNDAPQVSLEVRPHTLSLGFSGKF